MEPEKKKKGWAMLYVLTGAIDAVQIVIDLVFPPLGEIANEILDPVIGILLGLYFWKKGILDIVAGSSFFVAILAKEGTLGAAPAWVAVTGIVHFNYTRQQIQQKVLAPIGKVLPGPLNQLGTRLPGGLSAPLNSGGVRAPVRNPDIAVKSDSMIK